jgi:hypothetical protein
VVLLVEQQPWVAAHEVEVAAPLRVSWACQLSPTVTVRCLWVCVRLRAQTRPAPSSYTSGGGGGRGGGGLTERGSALSTSTQSNTACSGAAPSKRLAITRVRSARHGTATVAARPAYRRAVCTGLCRAGQLGCARTSKPTKRVGQREGGGRGKGGSGAELAGGSHRVMRPPSSVRTSTLATVPGDPPPAHPQRPCPRSATADAVIRSGLDTRPSPVTNMGHTHTECCAGGWIHRAQPTCPADIQQRGGKAEA